MASQPKARAGEICTFTIQSYMRGYHIYVEQWEPRIGEVLPLERESSNSEDKFAVSIKQMWKYCLYIIHTYKNGIIIMRSARVQL